MLNYQCLPILLLIGSGPVQINDGARSVKFQGSSMQEDWKLAWEFKHQEAEKSFSSGISVGEQETKMILSMWDCPVALIHGKEIFLVIICLWVFASDPVPIC